MGHPVYIKKMHKKRGLHLVNIYIKKRLTSREYIHKKEAYIL